jgi:hypothetical protein
MSLNLNNVKTKLERLTCVIHHQHPEIRVIGSELKFNCCCQAFQEKCVTASKKAFEDEAERAITDTLNKAFKKFR